MYSIRYSILLIKYNNIVINDLKTSFFIYFCIKYKCVPLTPFYFSVGVYVCGCVQGRLKHTMGPGQKKRMGPKFHNILNGQF